MSAALGHWPNAPLAYVLAQVRFEPFLEIERHIPALQSSLRERYPRFKPTERVILQVQPQPEAQPPRLQPARLVHWAFGSGSNQTGVLVQQDSLVFHATAYATYATFAVISRSGCDFSQKSLRLTEDEQLSPEGVATFHRRRCD